MRKIRYKRRKKILLIAAALGICFSALSISACSNNAGTKVSVNHDDEKDREIVSQLANEFLQAVIDGDTEKMYRLSGNYNVDESKKIREEAINDLKAQWSQQFGFDYTLDEELIDEIYEKNKSIIHKDYSIKEIKENNGYYDVNFSATTISNNVDNVFDLVQTIVKETTAEIEEKILDLMDESEYLRIYQSEGEEAALKYMYDSIMSEYIDVYYRRLEEGLIYKNVDGHLKVEKSGDGYVVSKIGSESVSEYIEKYNEGYLQGLEMCRDLSFE